MKNWKHFTFIGVLVILVFAFALGCTGNNSGNSLDGTWKGDYNGTDARIEFTGKNFTVHKDNGLFGRKGEGTYSIGGDKIILSFSDGKTKTLEFTRVEEAIVLGKNMAFTREK